MDDPGVVPVRVLPGDDERRQQARRERLESVRGAEVHERDAAVHLGDPVLEAGGDSELLGLDVEREPGECVRREGDGMTPHRARSTAITIALEPARPTERGMFVPQRISLADTGTPVTRCRRITAALTRSAAGVTIGVVAGATRAQAARSSNATASTAPP